MSRQTRLSPWPRSVDIPIILETHKGRKVPDYLTPPNPLAQFEFFPPPPTASRSVTSSRSESRKGLGIKDGHSHLSSITGHPPTKEKGESSPNIAQRIEKRLFRYSLSGNVVKRWLLEIVSWILSAICMGTIIGMLIFFKGKRPPPISTLDLTLNTYIAVLSKVASAALLLPTSEALGQLKWSWFRGGSKKMWDFEIFDNASRGPWGSFLLLIRTKGRYDSRTFFASIVRPGRWLTISCLGPWQHLEPP